MATYLHAPTLVSVIQTAPKQSQKMSQTGQFKGQQGFNEENYGSQFSSAFNFEHDPKTSKDPGKREEDQTLVELNGKIET